MKTSGVFQLRRDKEGELGGSQKGVIVSIISHDHVCVRSGGEEGEGAEVHTGKKKKKSYIFSKFKRKRKRISPQKGRW